MSASDKITDFAISKLNAAFDAVQHTLPTVTKYVMEVTSLNCLFSLICFLPLLLLAAGCQWVAFWWLRQDVTRDDWEIYYDPIDQTRKNREIKGGKVKDMNSNGYMPGFIIFTGIAVGLIAIFLVQIFDPWSWVCVFHPDLYLVHRAVEKVTR